MARPSLLLVATLAAGLTACETAGESTDTAAVTATRSTEMSYEIRLGPTLRDPALILDRLNLEPEDTGDAGRIHRLVEVRGVRPLPPGVHPAPSPVDPGTVVLVVHTVWELEQLEYAEVLTWDADQHRLTAHMGPQNATDWIVDTPRQ